MSSEAALRAYVRRGQKHVSGWLNPAAVGPILLVAQKQVKLGVLGGVSEIGVHHGRLFILLHLLSRSNERSAAYDLFEMQGENVDASGSGDKAAFQANLHVHGCDTARIVVKSRNSLSMTAAEVLADAGPVRLFSVDGGHTAAITASDLALAEASLCPGGVIILDDFFNEAWPGVCEGGVRYLTSGASKLVPVAISSNKFMLTNSAEFAAKYRDALRSLSGNYVVSDQTVFDAPVVVLHVKPLASRLASTWLWGRMRKTGAGRLLRSAALRVLAR